jgi:phosphoenolpyruvate-protein kinase (PTS system EI component)
MEQVVLRGTPAAPGAGVGEVRLVAIVDGGAAGDPAAELAGARRALAGAQHELAAVAERLRADGHAAEAEIVETGALMAADPALDAAVEAAVAGGLAAAAAITAAAEQHAVLIAALPDERLAARADDVRSLGRRAAALAAGTEQRPPDGAPVVLVAADLGPADVVDLEGVAGIALAAGGPTAHAAIVARSLGVPMVVGLGDAVLALAEGERAAVDGTRGEVVLRPASEPLRSPPRPRRSLPRTPVHTTDGQRVRVLVNAAGAAEVRAGLAAGAEGVGLLRTELAFLRATAWPSEAEHRTALAAALGALEPGTTATVRVLDLGGDKSPPFLAPGRPRGIALLLSEPEALGAQLRAIVAAGEGLDLRVLLPMTETPEQVLAVRELVPGATVGAMVETPRAAGAANALAAVSDFLSIGTNDLAHETLGTDRFGTGAAPAYHPAVLRHIARTAAVGRTVEVCGEAASDPIAMPLLVGLGVRELSVGAARVTTVRGWVGSLSRRRAAAVAERALDCDGPDAVAALVRAELGGFAEAGEAAGESLDGRLAVGAVGADQQG